MIFFSSQFYKSSEITKYSKNCNSKKYVDVMNLTAAEATGGVKNNYTVAKLRIHTVVEKATSYPHPKKRKLK